MELYKMKNESATRWAFGSRMIREDLNSLEVAGVERLTAWALDELENSGEFAQTFRVQCGNVGDYFLRCQSAWIGGALWFVYSSPLMGKNYTLKGGEVLRCACVVGFALLLVFEEPDTGREVVYRVIC